MTSLVPAARSSLMTPTNMRDAMMFADRLADSALVPKDYQGKPGNVLVALQWGQEIGLGPMQALQAIAIINGRAALWGDTLLALARNHPGFVSIDEGVRGEGDERHGYCTVERRGQNPTHNEFSVADAKKAGLWGKQGPWQNYPDRMMKMRARGFSLRDAFPDAIRGLYIAEEAQDIPAEPRAVPNLADAAPQPSHPVVAREGSMREFGAEVAGRQVERPLSPAEDDEALPLVSLDGILRELRRGRTTGAPAPVVWQAAALREVARAESTTALRVFREVNGPHFASIAGQHPDIVAAVEAAIEARVFAPIDEPEPEVAE